MDALVALKVDLSCDPHVPGEMLVLSAEKARGGREAPETASASLKHVASAPNRRRRGDTSELERHIQRQVTAHAPVHDTYHSELEQDGEAYPRGVLADALRDRDT